MHDTTRATREEVALMEKQRSEKAVAVSTRILGKSAERSTAEQRQAFLEGIYANYVELRQQADELHERKRFFDYELFQSNNKEIHDLLFGNLDAHEEELGDWDTWERVEAIVKKFAYGRPHYDADDRDELTALKERAGALSHTVVSQQHRICEQEKSVAAAQDEISGLVNLVRIKDRELRFLIGKNNASKLQLRQAERECQALREPQGGATARQQQQQQICEDLKLLIGVNKQLERENTELRGKLHVKYGTVAPTGQEVSAEYLAPLPEFSTLFPVDTVLADDDAGVQAVEGKLTKNTLREHERRLNPALDPLINDSQRLQLLWDKIPISAAVMEAHKRVERCMNDLQGEVSNAMDVLDVDANVIHRRNGPASARPCVGECAEVKICQTDADASHPILRCSSRISPPHWHRSSSSSRVPCSRDGADDDHDEDDVPDSSAVVHMPLQTHKGSLVDGDIRDDGQGARRRTNPSLSPNVPENHLFAGVSQLPFIVQTQMGAASQSLTAQAHPDQRSAWKDDSAHSAVGETRATLEPMEADETRGLSASEMLRHLLQENAEMRRQLKLPRGCYNLQADGEDVVAARGTVIQCPHRSGRGSPSRKSTPMASQPVGSSQTTGSSSVEMLAVASKQRQGDREREVTAGSSRICSVVGATEGSQSSVNVSMTNLLARPTGTTAGATDAHQPQQTSGNVAPTHPANPAGLRIGNMSDSLAMTAHMRQELTHIRAHVRAMQEEMSSLLDLLVVVVGSGSVRMNHPGETEKPPSTLATEAAPQPRSESQAFDRASNPSSPDGCANDGNGAAPQEPLDAFVDTVVMGVLEQLTEQRVKGFLSSQHGIRLSETPKRAGDGTLPTDDAAWFVEQLKTMLFAEAKGVAMQHVGAHVRQSAQPPSENAGQQAVRGPITHARAMVQPPPPQTRGRVPHFAHLRDAGSEFTNRENRTLEKVPRIPQTFTSARLSTNRDDNQGMGRAPMQPVNPDLGADRVGVGEDRKSSRGSRPHNQPRMWSSQKHPFDSAALWGGRLDIHSDGNTSIVEGDHEAIMRMIKDFQSRAAVAGTADAWRGLRPIVLHYNTANAVSRANRLASAVAPRLLGSELDQKVQHAVSPIVSAMEDLEKGSRLLDTALLTAIGQLRKKEEDRERQERQLLLRRVATNLRTRHLLRNPLFQGNAFVSFIGLLYEKWRTNLERERQRLLAMRTQEHRFSAIRAILQHHFTFQHTPASRVGRPDGLPPLSGSHNVKLQGGSRGRAAPHEKRFCSQKSSNHFHAVTLPNDDRDALQ